MRAEMRDIPMVDLAPVPTAMALPRPLLLHSWYPQAFPAPCCVMAGIVGNT